MKELLLREKIKILQALSDETRLRIIDALKKGERCVCEIYPALGKSQSLISEHLRVLREANILDSRRDGRRIIYFISDQRIAKLCQELDEIVSMRVKERAEALARATLSQRVG
jgi:ArsR family transcriptional regulator